MLKLKKMFVKQNVRHDDYCWKAKLSTYLLWLTQYSVIDKCILYANKNSSVDEIVNVNVFTTTSYMWRPVPMPIEPTSYLC